MPRRARLSLGGIPWHVIQRGNNRSVCFFAEEDYRFYLDHLEKLARRFDCRMHAYVLMTNHVHLLLTPERTDSVALLMKHLGQRYVQYVNRTYRRSGTLWEGRVRCCLTQDYVLAATATMNPVRAAMVSQPRDYRWSSYHANAQGKADSLINPHAEYLRLGRDDTARREAYRALFKAHLNAEMVEEIRKSTNGNFALGGERFTREIEEALARRARRGDSGRPRRKQDSASQRDLL